VRAASQPPFATDPDNDAGAAWAPPAKVRAASAAHAAPRDAIRLDMLGPPLSYRL
jgi:hypothetical protein